MIFSENFELKTLRVNIIKMRLNFVYIVFKHNVVKILPNIINHSYFKNK